jgi:HAD superfamily hydrolase (TIGR01509 family)
MLKAIVFDLDGTLVSTDLLHFEAYRRTLLDHGLEIDLDFYHAHMSGVPNRDLARKLLPRLSDEEKREVVALKEARFREQAHALEAIDGLAEVIAWTTAKGLTRAVVTSAPRENVVFLLEAIGLENAFSLIVYADELPRGKPDPMPYRVALEQLGVRPDKALVFEDAPAGIVSATGAGIVTIGVASTQKPENLRAAGAALVIEDFSDPALWEMLRYALGEAG